jgi:hypothetical protein
MSEHEHKNDPWANLAESLGAKPAPKPAAKPAAEPAAAAPATPPRPPQKPREERPAAPVRSDWGGLASTLGLEPTASPPASKPQPAAPRPPVASAPLSADEPPAHRSEREQDEFSFGFGSRRPAAPAQPQGREPVRPPKRDGSRDERRDAVRRDTDAPADLRPAAETGAREESGADAAPRGDRGDEQGEGRGRRRRGRRGGRGRGRREEGRGDDRDRPLPGRETDQQTDGRRPDAPTGHDNFGEPRGERLDESTERTSLHRDAVDGDHGGPRQEPAGEGEDDADGAPRRRRRRGRRGGRRRGRGEGDGGGRPLADREGSESARDPAEGAARFADQDGDDEPLPTGYGSSRPQARPAADAGRPDASRADGEPSGSGRSDERESGEPGGRRRRRRRRGEGRSRDARGTAAPAEGGRDGSASRRSSESSGRRGRRGRRSTGDDRRSASTFERGRRDEFAPVAGRREEDDEGLEFLGIEDAGTDGHGRNDRHSSHDDESIIESGLNEVLDVPSWVEAIGIVIAGNLDARSRSPRGGGGGGGGGETRSDSSARGGSSDRPRDSRRGGRSDNQR